MLTAWNNCKLGVKLQASFALVMLFFVAALVGVLVAHGKVAAVHSMEDAQLRPARTAILRAELFARGADDDAAYYIADRRPAQSARNLAAYRRSVADLKKELQKASRLAQNEKERSAIDDYHAFLDGLNEMRMRSRSKRLGSLMRRSSLM